MKLHQVPADKIPENYCSREPSRLTDYDIEKIELLTKGEESEAWFWYTTCSYEGCGYMIIKVGASWHLKSMSHCSCYGPTESMEGLTPYASLDALLQSCTDELLGHLAPIVEIINNPPTTDDLSATLAAAADVKAAHARGEKVEARSLFPGEHHEWFVPANPPAWSDNYEYRIAPSAPAPAIRLSDEQLGEIGAKAASEITLNHPNKLCQSAFLFVTNGGMYEYGYKEHAAARTAFAAAIAEAVRAESAEEIEKLKNANALEFISLNRSLPINRDGSVKIIDHAIATLEELTAKRDEALKSRDEWKGRHDSIVRQADKAVEDRDGKIATLRAENAKQAEEIARLGSLATDQAGRLASIKWMDASVTPECRDYPIVQDNGQQKMVVESGSSLCLINAKRWVSIPKMPAPTKEESQREAFEAAYQTKWPCFGGGPFERVGSGQYLSSKVEECWQMWQAALASKEAKP